jgi:glucosamine-6-phosphate deaminase
MKETLPERPDINLIDAFERVSLNIFATTKEGSHFAARQIAGLIQEKQARGETCVLGLATGSTPITLYAELVRLHREEGLSFKNVVTFNLDEYYPIDNDALQSYNSYMHRLLFNHIDIDKANVHIPDGALPKEKIKEHCAAYERKIEEVGGIDLQILGIGTNGHIGFNEPGSSIHSRTRLINLENSTRLANAYEFANISEVPRLAITMGIGTIMKARRILLLAFGPAKAPVVQKAAEGPVTESVPASLLQQHPDCAFVLDSAAAAELTRNKTPWLTGEIEWSAPMIKRGVVHMALKLGKPVLSLTNNDYNEYGLGDLLVEQGDAYEINLQVYYLLRDSITGWPGGKPNVAIPGHPERSAPYPKRVLLFSPHPDDDIISMGGTFQRLHDQGHEVHVAYQTSGNIAVADDEAFRFIEFVQEYNRRFGIQSPQADTLYSEARSFLKAKKSGEVDSEALRAVKGLIRKGEARATCRFVGVPMERVHFLDLPFYETGTVEKRPIGEDDVRIIASLIGTVKPHQVFAAGDLADPHGTHKVCLDGILEAFAQLKGKDVLNDCWLWLYKGAWAEWDIDLIEMAVPMSPDQVLKKRYGIFKHQSQKDGVVFQGSDNREFWQRAEERNRATADLYNKLGLAEYAAMEAFVRWRF